MAWQQLTVGKLATVDCWAEVYVENLAGVPVWFDDLKIQTGALPVAVVVQEVHYDPWGLELAGIGYNAGGNPEHDFKFQGKELVGDFGLGWYDFQWRQYDPVLGRANAVDPHAENYHPMSPYSFLGNNPMMMVDPDGRDWVIAQENRKDGSTHYTLTFRARLVNESGTQYTQDQLQGFVDRIKDGLGVNSGKGGDKAFNGSDGSVSWSINVDLEVATEENTNENHHLVKIVDDGDKRLGQDSEGNSNSGNSNGGQRDIFINNKIADNRPVGEGGLDAKGNPSLERTSAHEVGHTGGLRHPIEHVNFTDFRNIPRAAFERKPRNLMHQSRYSKVAGFSLVAEQVSLMYRFYQGGALKIRN